MWVVDCLDEVVVFLVEVDESAFLVVDAWGFAEDALCLKQLRMHLHVYQQ